MYNNSKELVNPTNSTLIENPYFWVFAIVAVVVLGVVLAIWITSRRKTGVNSHFRAGRRPSDIEMDSLGPGRRKEEEPEKSKNSRKFHNEFHFHFHLLFQLLHRIPKTHAHHKICARCY